ncbi:DUF982 domain-containing protein [Agrobacterium sp. DE0009]|uniref:DUF982 domain-containing protein n=1 Tax=Agrobacterium sp. DE0009 TaxID=2587505 RepID=UPI0011A143B7|nr:DUF982 domain-containing protein [Agrobacterium sp. DE0009]
MKRFNIKPVTIKNGDFIKLETVKDLASYLFKKWPGPENNRAYLTAVMVCSAVLENGLSERRDDARAAFVAAAHEARLVVLPDDGDPQL